MATNSGWAALGGLIGGAFRGGRDTNEGGSVFGGKRTLLKDALEGGGAAQDEQFADAAKKAKSLRALFKLYGADMGQPQLADHAETLSLGELEGGLKTYVLKQDAEERKQKLDYQAALMQNLKDVRDERARDASATEAFSRYATQPAAQEQWQGALAGGPTMAGAATLEQPLRAPTGPETASAFVRAMRTGGMPDARAVSALSKLAPEGEAAQWDVNKEAVPGMSLVAKRGSQVWQAFPSGGEPQTVTVRDPSGLPFTYIPNPKSGALTPVGNGAGTLTAAQAEEAYTAAEKNASRLRFLKRMAAKDPEAKAMWGADSDAELARAESDVQRFDALRKRGSGAAATPAAGGAGVIMVNPQGQRVRVPADQVEKARAAGYQ